MEAFSVDFGEISDFVGEWAHQPHLGGPYKAGALRPASLGPHLHTPGSLVAEFGEPAHFFRFCHKSGGRDRSPKMAELPRHFSNFSKFPRDIFKCFYYVVLQYVGDVGTARFARIRRLGRFF